MDTVILSRDSTGPAGTFGQLWSASKGHLGFTGELPWRNNERGISCIPEGKYSVKFLARSGSGKYKNVYHVWAVPGRSGILIHAGNLCGDRELGLKSDVDGCILLGTKTGVLGTQRAVLRSKTAMHGLRQALGTDPFELIVWDRTNGYE
jgi:Family of unknown function (DUF5675)